MSGQGGNGQQSRVSHGGPKTSPPEKFKVRGRPKATVQGDKLSTRNDQGANKLQK